MILCDKNEPPQNSTVQVKRLTGFTVTKNLRVIENTDELCIKKKKKFPPHLLNFSEVGSVLTKKFMERAL